MLLRVLLLAASVVASPLDALKKSPGTASNCPGHTSVFVALQSFSAAASFCSQEISISPVTHVVSSTSTLNVATTTVISVAPTKTSSTTLTFTSLTTAYQTIATPTTTVYSTITSTITAAAGASLPACAVSNAVAKVKRSPVSTPSQLSGFSDKNLAAGCSCLSLSTQQVTSTKVITTTVPAGSTTSVSTPISYVTYTTTYTTTKVVTITPAPISTTVTSSVSVTISGPGSVSTPTAFYLKSPNGAYVSLASLTGGAFYLQQSSSAGADQFSLNSANQLVVVTPGSKYNGFIAVGTPPGQDPAYDWYSLSVSKSGIKGGRPALCCGMTAGHLLTCGGGEVFANCFENGVYEGSTVDYDYTGLGCTQVSLSIVTQ